MYYLKHGFPEESEIVLCTVTSVQYNCVFASLDEYEGKSGIIHISEIAPGRIRNIRDYVAEGKKVICKVLKVNLERGHIDLSLRRVTEMHRKNKNSQIKQELLAEKIIEFAAKELKVPMPRLYKEVSEKIFKHYDYVYPCFEEIMMNQFKIADLGLDKQLSEKIEELIRQRIKPPEVEIGGLFTIISYAPDGVEIIRNALKKGKDAGKGCKDLNLKYIGAGKYRVALKAPNYKEAEEILAKIVEAVEKDVKEHKAEISFDRIEIKDK